MNNTSLGGELHIAWPQGVPACPLSTLKWTFACPLSTLKWTFLSYSHWVLWTALKIYASTMKMVINSLQLESLPQKTVFIISTYCTYAEGWWPREKKGSSDLSSFQRNYPSLFKSVPVQLLGIEPRVLLSTAKDRPSSPLLQSKEACPCGRQYWVSAVSEISFMFLCTGFWNSSKGPFILGETPRLDLGWFLEGDQALSLWSGSIDSKTTDNHRTNSMEYQIVRTHINETT